jgi:hypothetical protein
VAGVKDTNRHLTKFVKEKQGYFLTNWPTERGLRNYGRNVAGEWCERVRFAVWYSKHAKVTSNETLHSFDFDGMG